MTLQCNTGTDSPSRFASERPTRPRRILCLIALFTTAATKSILGGYRQTAGGHLNSAKKSYGESTAYAQKIQSRAVELSHLRDAGA